MHYCLRRTFGVVLAAAAVTAAALASTPQPSPQAAGAQELCEQLRLILEATVASKMQGDYRSGKRISMRKAREMQPRCSRDAAEMR